MLTVEQSAIFMNELENVIKSRFPNSFIKWRINKQFVTNYQLFFNLAKDYTECANGIPLNDAMNWVFTIWTCDKQGCLNDEIEIELNRNTICRIADKNDDKEKYCVYGRVKVPYRKIKGNCLNCIEKMKKFINKTVEIMLANADAINNGTIKGLFTVADKIA